MKCSLSAIGLSMLLAGCFTVRETEYPPVVIGALGADKNVRIQLSGFDATITTYDTIYGYSTIMGFDSPWYYGPRGRYRGGFHTTTYSTTEFVPRVEKTPFYRDRATDLLERAGCVLKTTDPEYRLEVRFLGPYAERGDGWASAGWMIFSVFTAAYDVQMWDAQLRIYEVKSGKLVFSHDYVQRDEALVWGLIPLFSPACSDRNSASVMKMNCLTALTDHTIADAVSFLSKR